MRFALAVCLSACTFEHGAAGVAPSDSPAPADARGDARGDAAFDAFVAKTCETTDPSLVWCLEFDEANLATATTAIDGSAGNHDPSISNITTTTRAIPASSQAITTTTSSSISIAKPTAFNVNTFTITAWVRRTSNAELGILDTDHQYTMSINSSDHTVECAASNGAQTQGLNGSSPTGSSEWDLVACSYDGTQLCTYSFRNGATGVQSGCQGRTATTATNGTMTTVGSWADGTSHFVGSIDQVRVYSRALTETEICTAGGLTGC